MVTMPSKLPLRIGVAGLGVASTQVLPAFKQKGKPYQLTAGADNRKDARSAFEKEYGCPAENSVEALCRRDDVDAVWISTPNTVHAEHAICVANHGKHIICEKPMAVTLAECERMIRAAARNKVHFLQGHSKIYGAPIKAMRDVVASGRLGKVLQIQSANYNDWLQRPRLAPEVDTKKGGGLVYRQGPHMIDIVRYIGGGKVKTVRGVAGRADRNFKTEGHFSAFLEFEKGAVATLTFNGYGYFDGAQLTWNIGESGLPQSGNRAFSSGPRLTGPVDPKHKTEGAAKRQATKKGSREKRRQPFFGLTIVSCERGVIRQSPEGLYVYTEDGCEEIVCETGKGREGELLELASALAERRPAFPNGKWGKATLEVCLAIMASSRDGRSRTLRHQVAVP
jgi:phthalate 4,5-cis-dihydrodiol dehydrogenase